MQSSTKSLHPKLDRQQQLQKRFSFASLPASSLLLSVNVYPFPFSYSFPFPYSFTSSNPITCQLITRAFSSLSMIFIDKVFWHQINMLCFYIILFFSEMFLGFSQSSCRVIAIRFLNKGVKTSKTCMSHVDIYFKCSFAISTTFF